MHTRHRPTSLEEVIGHDLIKTSLKKKKADPNREHMYIFSGTYGLGKSTFARIFAKELGANPEGIKEVDIRGIDTARDLLQEINGTSLFSNVKVYIINEAQLMTKDASDSLLRVTEEPPSHVYFILCTSEPNKIAPALFKRGIHYPLKPLTNEQIIFLLKSVIRKEKQLGNEIKINKNMAELLISKAKGVPRDLLTGLSLIQTCQTVEEARLLLSEGIPTEAPEVIEIAKAILLPNNYPSGVFQQLLATNLDKIKNSPEEFRVSIEGYLTKVTLSPSNAAFYEDFATSLILLGEPTPDKAYYGKLIGLLIKAYTTMRKLKS